MKHKTRKLKLVSLIIAAAVLTNAVALGKETNLRPLAAGERRAKKDLAVSRVEMEVVDKITDLFERWNSVRRNKLIAMGFSERDIVGLQKLYSAVWPHTNPGFKYLAGGHLFYGAPDGLFDRLQTNWFAHNISAPPRNWPQVGNTVEDAYIYGHFKHAVASDNSDGYIAIFDYTFFNDRVANGKAFIGITPQGTFFCVQDLPIQYTVKIIVTKKGMNKIRRIYRSDRTDVLAHRIRRFVNKKMFIVTKGLEGSPWVYGEDKLGRELRGTGIGGARVIPTHETDIIWTLRERGMQRLRTKLIKVLGRSERKERMKTSDLHIKHFREIEASI